ncbi:non-ribosomal peptide synthetase [Gordonia humi]|uniref:Amino acid adenylation domain-containing protein/non-ribosomal peptide synthase protein (TIGR01720 family) n=2 Tax=Gordonia humi TaxID=686429 RepID=A0A840EMF3_9ACTN|nr:non-ribosomal peptide synthetase [Gordonia humi]MBB4133965.1 amino acid adenylation domain-containing protein/non-ribosomal peptide synthase protein (TIGR01720 family) [Gordonia humi]
MNAAASDSTIPSLLARQAESTPHSVAVVDARARMTYRELAHRVADLADDLVAAGVGPETVVGVGMPRSAEMVVTVLAVMTAGGAFVPIDPTWPPARRRHVIDSADARLVVTAAAGDRWPVPELTIDVTAPVSTGAADPIERLAAFALSTPAPGDGKRLAYVIFTSGSTGNPKGAMIRHEAICERLLWQRDEILHFGSDDATLFKAPLAFDISVNEILLPLVSGGRVVVAAAGEEADPDRLLHLIETERVTFVYLVSSMLDVLLEMDRERAAAGRSAMAGLRHVWCGGEVLTPGLFARFREQTTTTLYHGYGPAEATIGVSHVVYREQAERIATSIGRPNPHTRLYVVDERLAPLGVGEPGELYAAGFLLGRGYVNAAELTASRFVADPFGPPGERMYRTGDRARWTDDGSLEFLGRVDNQVKLRGRRIELEEIEAAVASADGVRHCAVGVVDHGSTQRLVAYVTAAAGVGAHWSATDAVTESCARTLPDYMIPEIVMTLETMPTTANGKIDRRALPAPVLVSSSGAEPSTPEESLLCDVFAEVLGLDRVAVDDDFFASGGDSIIAIRVVSALRRAGMTVRVRDVFAARTPAELAPVLRPAEEASIAAVAPRGALTPTPILHWLHEVAAPAGLDGFYQGIALTVPSGADAATLQRALDAVVAAHPALTASMTSATSATIPDAPVEVALAVETVPGETDDAALAAAAAHVADRTARLIDHTGSPGVTAATWIDRPGASGRLVLIAHHTVVDGISLRIVAEDLATAIAEPDAVAAEPVSWRAWSTALADAARAGVFDDERDHWVRTCERPAGVLGRECDRARDTVATERTHTVELDVDLTRHLVDVLPAAVHGSPNDALVAALAVAVGELTGADGTTIEMEGHGREPEAIGDLDLSRTVGWFTTLYPVHIDLADVDESDVSALVRSVKEQLRAVPRQGIGYGALRYLVDDPVPAHRAPVLFNYLGRFARSDADWSMAPGTVPYEGRDPAMPLPRPLEVNAVVADGPDGPRMSAAFSRPSGVLTADEVQAVADRWVQVLSAIAAADIAGHTPSDFPTVRLSSADIASLESADPDLRDVLAPTSTQQGIVFHSAEATNGVGDDPYLVQQIIDVHGPVDPDRLARAAHTVITRHRALSARFVQVDDGSTVVVTGGSPAPEFRVVDAREDADAGATAVDRAAREDRGRGFDITRAPLTRYTLVRLGDTRHRLVQTVHHVVADGWSVPLVLAELRRAYAGVPRAGADRYAAAVRTLLDRDRDAERTAWTRALDGLDDATSLVAAFDPSSRIGDPARDGVIPGVGTRRAELDNGVRARLVEFARGRGVTVGAVLHTAWGLTLGLLTGRTDVAFGTVVSGRGHGLDDVVGMFVNTVPARVRWSASRPLVDTVDEHARWTAEIVDHPHIALTELHRSTGVSALFDTLLVVENLPDVGAEDTDAGFSFGDVEVIEAPHYPLTVMVGVHDAVSVTVTNRRAELGDGPADAAAALFVEVLAVLARSDDGTTGRAVLDLESVPEHAGQEPMGRTDPASTPADTIADRIARVLPSLPDLVVSGEITPAADVVARTEAFRDDLRERGVGAEDRVAVMLGRGVDLVCASLAVVAAGAVLVPIDPAYPADRIAYMLDTAAPTTVIDADYRPGTGPAVPRNDAATAPVRPDNGAYLLFTSGSTGVPKAVLGTQRAVAARLAWQHPTDERAGARLVKSSLSFVDGLTELLAAALTAETIVVADATQTHDLRALAALIEQWSIDEVTTIPSAAAALRRSCADEVASVHRWVVSAEPLTGDVVAEVAGDGRELVNFYGSSEVTGDVTAGAVAPGERVTVGRPVPHARVTVLDRWLRPVPDGAIGELYATGPQTARGYHGAPGLTATRFVPDPAGEPGARMYRTGDLAARMTDGRLVLHGRADLQFSIRGMRVEAGEVEAALRNDDAVTGAVVAAVGEPARLVAYVVAPGDGTSESRLVDRLASTLPRQSVPDQVVFVDELPLTPGGKVDRAALPDPADRATTGRAPATPTEQALVDIIADVLGRASVAADDDFFALGGDSISSVAVVGRALRSGLQLTTGDVFRHRTAQALAAACVPVAERRPVPPTPVLHQIRTFGQGTADLVYTEVVEHGPELTVAEAGERLGRLAARLDAVTMRVIPRNRLIWAADAGGDSHIPLTVVDGSEPGLERTLADAAETARAAVDIAAGRSLAAVAVTGETGYLVLAAHALALDRASLHAVAVAVATATDGDSSSVIDAAAALDGAAQHDDYRAYALEAGQGAPELSDVERALVDAVRGILGEEALIDVEADLRAVPGVDRGAAGPWTPTVPLEYAGSSATRHWHALAQLHEPAVRKTMRRRRAADVLVTRFYGAPAGQRRAEGVECRYPIVARYRIADDGRWDVSVIGSGDDDTASALARAWSDRLHGDRPTTDEKD